MDQNEPQPSHKWVYTYDLPTTDEITLAINRALWGKVSRRQCQVLFRIDGDVLQIRFYFTSEPRRSDYINIADTFSTLADEGWDLALKESIMWPDDSETVWREAGWFMVFQCADNDASDT